MLEKRKLKKVLVVYKKYARGAIFLAIALDGIKITCDSLGMKCELKIFDTDSENGGRYLVEHVFLNHPDKNQDDLFNDVKRGKPRLWTGRTLFAKAYPRDITDYLVKHEGWSLVESPVIIDWNTL